MTSHDFDVTMADSTFTFGNIMRMDDLGGEAARFPSCTVSVLIPKEIAKAIEDELNASSGTIADLDIVAELFNSFKSEEDLRRNAT